MTAAGVARPRAQGHATISTAEARSAISRGSAPASAQPSAGGEGERARTAGREAAGDPVGEALERGLLRGRALEEGAEPRERALGGAAVTSTSSSASEVAGAAGHGVARRGARPGATRRRGAPRRARSRPRATRPSAGTASPGGTTTRSPARSSRASTAHELAPRGAATPSPGAAPRGARRRPRRAPARAARGCGRGGSGTRSSPPSRCRGGALSARVPATLDGEGGARAEHDGHVHRDLAAPEARRARRARRAPRTR